MVLGVAAGGYWSQLEVRIGPRKVYRGRLFAVVGAVGPARLVREGKRWHAAYREPGISLVKRNVLFRMLVSLVPQWVAKDVVHAAFVPAFERVVTTEGQGHAVPEPRSPQDGIIIRHVLVNPSNIAIGRLVPIIMIADSVQKSGVLEVDA